MALDTTENYADEDDTASGLFDLQSLSRVHMKMYSKR